jgi:hypothetical protein
MQLPGIFSSKKLVFAQTHVVAKIRTFPTSYILLIDIDNTINFDSYIHQYAFVFEIIKELNDEFSMKHFKKSFSELNEYEKEDFVEQIYFRVIDANSAEIDKVKYLLQKGV